MASERPATLEGKASVVTAPLRWRPRLSLRAGPIGMALLLLIAGPCFVMLPWSVHRYSEQRLTAEQDLSRQPPSLAEPMGTDGLGRSLLWRCLMGGTISLGVGIAAAGIAVTIGVAWGALAGYVGGRTDALMMRIVDVLYGLPYILMVVLLDLALSPVFERGFQAVLGLWMTPRQAASVGTTTADVVTLLVAIGAVSWLTMARVIRGQVLSLREQPFVEAAKACGVGPARILRVHLLPNLIGPIVVYTTLTVPQAILQESFLSFLGIGVRPPLPSWGNLAAEGVEQLSGLGLSGPASERWAMLSQPIELFQRFAVSVQAIEWWLVLFPCLLLGLTLMALNFLGDDLRARFDPKSH